jgi:hypothetical protein
LKPSAIGRVALAEVLARSGLEIGFGIPRLRCPGSGPGRGPAFSPATPGRPYPPDLHLLRHALDAAAVVCLLGCALDVLTPLRLCRRPGGGRARPDGR